MKILDSKFMKGFIKMADDGFQQGWHERNGGNLSYRLKAEEVEMIRPRLNAPGEWQPIGTEVPGLAGEFFLVTGSGKYFRNIAVDPEACLAIIELDDKGVNYRIRWGLVEGGRPTSELPTHLMNHEVKKKLTNGRHRVIYHAHTTNTIALTFVLPLDDKVFTRELWESATECPVVFPDGVGVVGPGKVLSRCSHDLVDIHQDAVDFLHGVQLAVRRVFHPALVVLEVVVLHGLKVFPQQIVLIFKIRIKAAVRHAALPYDVLDGHIGVAVLAEEGHGG